ncbi:alpha/beta hydrolase [Micromonospora sp. NPDC006766]|uniref:alpha/beta hydrolase n=1 Tax=Micromonospora sp. NPDC006766 TaxID=3154778 RepID=UPI0033CA8D51
MPRAIRSLIASGIAGIVLAGSAITPAVAAPLAAAKSDRTSAVEARRVDRVPTPKLRWYKCYGYAQCATVRLPRNYDKPKGATTEIALLRVKARDQKHKIGSLFINPGGPGGSGTGIALAAPYFLSDSLLDRFDIVGVDPRGVANSENIKCFRSVRDQTKASAGLNVAFPWTKAEEKAYVASSKAVGKACSTTGKPLTGAASTAEVARDMDVLRRAVGDKKLTYLGFSYGTALGQYYANMFPDRVRALVVDGVLNPNAWVGKGKARKQLQETRLRSADGAYKALREILTRCAKVGAEQCPLASTGNPIAAYDTVAKRLRKKPAVINDPDFGQFKISYADFVDASLGALYSPYGWLIISDMTRWLLEATDPAAPAPVRAQAGAALAKRAAKARQQRAYDFPYDNGYETFLTVDCTDAYHPKSASSWPKLVAAADKRAPYFGREWAWVSAPCARNTWTVRDKNAYTGPFNRRTSAPVLVVGNFWDPATNYKGAVSSAALLPNSRLLSSDSWGHTAYGTSDCVTGAIDRYLLKVKLPAKGTVCTGDDQPFVYGPDWPEDPDNPESPDVRATMSKSALAQQGEPRRGEPKRLPPVVTPLPLTGTLTVR